MEEILFSEIAGLSMYPRCRPHDKLLVKKIPITELRTGDIVIYATNGKMVCHRLVRKIKDKDRYILHIRGDCSLSLGERVREEDFLGRVTGIIRGDRIVSLAGPAQRLFDLVLLFISPLFSLAILIKRCLVPLKRTG
jgi:hypothetical protein